MVWAWDGWRYGDDVDVESGGLGKGGTSKGSDRSGEVDFLEATEAVCARGGLTG